MVYRRQRAQDLRLLGFTKQAKLFLMQQIREREVAQSCPTLCNPMDCNLPGSSVRGIFQARVLEWGAIAFSVRNREGIAKKKKKKR